MALLYWSVHIQEDLLETLNVLGYCHYDFYSRILIKKLRYFRPNCFRFLASITELGSVPFLVLGDTIKSAYFRKRTFTFIWSSGILYQRIYYIIMPSYEMKEQSLFVSDKTKPELKKKTFRIMSQLTTILVRNWWIHLMCKPVVLDLFKLPRIYINYKSTKII